MTVICIVKMIGTLLFVLYFVIPLTVRSSVTVQRHLIFMPFLRYPHDIDLTKPGDLGLDGAVHLRIKTKSSVELGAWHIPPKSLLSAARNESTLDTGRPVVIYLHGNSGSRAGPHRIEMYKLLQELDYHVFTFDYRGYADSSPVDITEDGVVNDTHAVIEYVKERKGNAPLILWGHSLGTGVGCRTAAELCRMSRCPDGLILESPFNNLRDEVRFHPFTYVYRYMPFFEFFFLDGMKHSGIEFNSDQHIKDVKSPIMILHAEDDLIVPIHLGKKLFESAKLSQHERSQELLKFVEFEAKHQYGHKLIYRAPELRKLVRNFVEAAISVQTTKHMV